MNILARTSIRNAHTNIRSNNNIHRCEIRLCGETDAFQPSETISAHGICKNQGTDLAVHPPSPINDVQPALKIYFLGVIKGTVCA